MNAFSRADLEILIRRREQPCISLYIPTYYAGPQVTGNAVRFKKHLAEAESRTVATGMSAMKAKELFSQAKMLLDDTGFWQHQSDGLALFLSPEMMRYYRVALHFDELLVVSDRFHVKPILPLLTNDGRFYIISLSKGGVRFYSATRYQIHEVELKGAPRSLADAMKLEEHEKMLSFHSAQGPTAGGGGHAAIHHGTGADSDREKGEILRYFQMVDGAVQKVVGREPGPVVLAGVEYLQAIYREADGKLRLVDDWFEGNPEALGPRELHQRCWNIVAPEFHRSQAEATSRFMELTNRNGSGKDRAPTEIPRILVASRDGRIQNLFVPLNGIKWGRFNEVSGEVRFDETPKPDSEDLFERAAIQTIVTGGTVYAVPPTEMPGRHPIAAVLRY